MASARLTRHIRESLLKKLITRAFQERAQDLVDRSAALAVEFYEDALAGDLEAIRALPRGWLPTDDDIKVYVAGDMERLCFNGSMGNGCLTPTLRQCGAKEASPELATNTGSFRRPELPFPAKVRGQCVKQYEAGHPMEKRLTDLKGEASDFETEVTRATKTAEAAMNSVTTVKKLIEVWPEVEEFARPYLVNGEQRAILPAIPRAELNAKLGLPPHEREVAGGTVVQ